MMITVDEKYIGIPFAEMDCWQLICHYYANELGIALPCYLDEYVDADDILNIRRIYDRETANRTWPAVADPRYPDLAVFKINGYLWHVGIVVDEIKKMMLHTQRGCSSVIERYDSMRWNRRLYGFYRYQR